MKKTFRTYLVIWAALLALFNVIAFVSPGWTGLEKYTPSFWIGYAVITVAFIGQLLCAQYAWKESNSTKLFYNVSLITLSFSGLIASFVVGGLCMLLSPLPYWVGAIVCAIVLAVNVMSVAKAKAAIDLVSEIDDRVKAQTFAIRAMTADAEGVAARAQSDSAKAACRSVYEALRYSDPVSSPALATVEAAIADKIDLLADAVKAGNDAETQTIADALLALIGDRNRKCKLLK